MGLRSHLRVLLPVLAVLATAATAAALDTRTHGEFREAFPQVDRAISSMPSSNLHGSFNRLSALLHSSPIRELGEGSSQAVPANVERNLVRAIDELRERLVPDLEEIDVLDRLALLQLTSVAVFQPLEALYSDADYEFCPDPTSGCESPAVLSALDRLAQDLIGPSWTVLQAYEEAAAGDASLPPVVIFPDEAYNAQVFPDIVDSLSDLFGWVHGEPIID